MKNISLKRYSVLAVFFIFVIFCFVIFGIKSHRKTAKYWNVKPTKHFLIYYEKNSPAEEDIRYLAKVLEEYFQESTQMFNIKITKKIPYYFHGGGLYASNSPVWGYATSKDIHALYSEDKKDSSPHELRHFIHHLVNHRAPYFFNEGACGFGIQIGGQGFHSRAREVCADLFKYPLLELVKEFKKYGRLGDYLAYSFNSFLIEQYGKEKFAKFYQKVTQDNWQELMRQVYGLSFSEIETKWKGFLCN